MFSDEYNTKFAHVCNIVARALYGGWPLPEDYQDGDYRHTGPEPRWAAHYIMRTLNIFEEEPAVDYGAETDPDTMDEIYWIAKLKMSHGDGFSEEWYRALYQRLRLGMSTEMPEN